MRTSGRIGAISSVVAAVALLALCAGCDSDEARTTGTITELPAGKLCLLPEDPEQTDLHGCFPLAPDDAERVRVGDCISVRVPNYLDEGNRETPLRSITVLRRQCKHP